MKNVKCARCVRCGKEYEAVPNLTNCSCGGILDIVYDYDYIKAHLTKETLKNRVNPTMWRYRELLPVEETTPDTPLRVGWSPLYEEPKLAEMLGLGRLWVKDDGINPTASLKDRASAMAVAKAHEAGAKIIACSSTGNAASSLAGNAAAAGFYEETARHLMDLLEVVPGLIVRDLHPDFFSSRFGEDLAGKLGVPCVALQHHAAHAASVLAENNYMAPALALTLDGTGLGTDGTVWGGELLFMDPGQPAFTRAGSLSPFPLPGGDQATRFPWRIALSLDLASRGADAVPFWRERQGMAADAVAEMLARRVNSPLTSSCGRLFDAVSALLGLCQETSYEGQAVIRLETAALGARRTSLPGGLPEITAEQAGGRLQISSAALFRRAKALSPALARAPPLSAFTSLSPPLSRTWLRRRRRPTERAPSPSRAASCRTESWRGSSCGSSRSGASPCSRTGTCPPGTGACLSGRLPGAGGSLKPENTDY